MQTKPRRQRAAMNSLTRTPVVAHEVTDVASVERLQDIHEFIKQHCFQIARVALTTNALVWRVHVDGALRVGLGDDLLVINRGALRLAAKKAGDAKNVLAHGLWGHAHAAIVGALVEFAISV